MNQQTSSTKRVKAPAATQPSLATYTKLRERQKRSRTTPHATTNSDSRQWVLSTIQSRLEAQGLQSSLRLIQEPAVLAFLLPQNESDAELWKALVDIPRLAMQITDDELQSMFSLRYTIKQSAREDKSIVFYLRSFKYAAYQLEDVMEYLQQDGIMLDSFAEWRSVLASVAADTTIYLRYIGRTNGTPWKRHLADLSTAEWKTGVRNVLQATQTIYPEITNSANVFEFVRAEVPEECSLAESISDVREQSAIALFGHGILLNKQAGGLHVPIEFSRDLEKELSKIRWESIEQLQRKTEPCSPEVVAKLQAWAAKTARYARSRPESTGTWGNSFTDDFIDTLVEQSIPKRMKGTEWTPLVMLADSVTLQGYQHAQKFSDTKSFTFKLVSEALSFFVNIEGQSSTVKSLFDEHFLPFNDLFNWTRRSRNDLPEAMALMRDYLKAVNPLVTITFSEYTSSVALGNFQHDQGIRKGDLRNLVGKPLVRYYSEITADDEAGVGSSFDEEDCVIVFPCYHPSCVSYGKLDPGTFVETFAFTLAMAWATTSIALRSPRGSTRKKKDFLADIVKEHEKVLGQGTSTGKAYQKVLQTFCNLYKGSAALSTSWRAQDIRGPYDRLQLDEVSTAAMVKKAELWEAARVELQMMMECGWALHDHNTIEAKRQGQRLGLRQFGPLKTRRTGYSASAISVWAAGVRKDHLYYLEATRASEQAKDIPHLLAIHAGPECDVDDVDWLRNEEAVVEARWQLERWIKAKIPLHKSRLDDAVALGQAALTRLMYKQEPQLPIFQRLSAAGDSTAQPEGSHKIGEVLQGCEVKIVSWNNLKASATLVFSWTDHEGTYNLYGYTRDRKNELSLPPLCLSHHANDSRFLWFVPEGIDIRNAQGLTLKAPMSPCTVTLETTRISLEGQKKEKLLELWARETKLDPNDALYHSPKEAEPGEAEVKKELSATVDDGSRYPAQFFQPRRRPNMAMDIGSNGGYSLSEVTAERQVRNNLPLQPGDALWLFHKFLEQHYPDRSDCNLARPVQFANADSMWVRLQGFLDLPRYAAHPMKQNLKDIAATALQAAAGASGCDTSVKVAMGVLRPGSMSERKRETISMKPKKVQAWRTIWRINGNEAPANVVPADADPLMEIDIENGLAPPSAFDSGNDSGYEGKGKARAEDKEQAQREGSEYGDNRRALKEGKGKAPQKSSKQGASQPAPKRKAAEVLVARTPSPPSEPQRNKRSRRH